MDYFPAFHDLKGRDCLLVGEGEAAARKLELLRRAGARVRVVVTGPSPELEPFRDDAAVSLQTRAFAEEDLDGVALVIAAPADDALAERVAGLARGRGLPFNAVDRPALCSFIVPSIVDRSPVVIGISTGGTSPVLARMVRTRLEGLLPGAFGALAAFAARMRERVRAGIADGIRRRVFWEEVLQGPVAEQVLVGNEAAAEAALDAALARAGEDARPVGEVYLVGAGPGDPDLLTFRALRLMQQADVVVYDRLVSDAILDLTRRDAARVYAGKRRGVHAIRQEGINELLVRYAKEGKRVLRLKGGDPFIFGRGGEEIDALAGEGIPFQVVPGITAASGCAAYAGIPLTHRDHAQCCVFVTGNRKDGSIDLDWDALARPNQTVVIYMGLSGLDIICAELTAHGLPASTPAALVQQGTTRGHRVIAATLADLPETVRRAGARAPTLVIVGGVVSLRDRLKWFEDAEQPLDYTDPERYVAGPGGD